MRWLSALGWAAVTGLTTAQAPDVVIFTDLRYTLHFDDQDARIRFYDLFGRPSLLNLQVGLERGLALRVAQRLQRVRTDPLENSLEFGFIEAPGEWRIGWIDVPFGRRWTVRDFGLGGEIRTQLFTNQIPLVIATVDNGERRTRGIAGRLGSRFGISAAVGDHWAASSGSLANVRQPESAPGIGRGYRLVLGADFDFRLGESFIRAEGVALRRGQTAADRDEDVLDLSLGFEDPPTRRRYELGFARRLRDNTAHFRFLSEVPVNRWLTFMVQFRVDDSDRLIGLGVRIRL